MTLELQRAREPRVCRLCGEPTPGAAAEHARDEFVCQRCGVDIRTGDLVNPPAPPPSGPTRDGTRPLRRRAARLLKALPKGTRQWLARGFKTSLQAWPASILCMFMIGVALSFQRVPWVNQPLPWPGQLAASFILAFLTVEHARGAREGNKAGIDTKGAFDPSMLGMSLMMAMLLFPLYAGPFMGSPWISIIAGLPVLLLFPACLGALVCDSADELGFTRLKEAIVESPRYLKTTLVSMSFLVGALLVVWLPSEQLALWRAPLAVIGTTIAATFCGLMRHDAECMIDDGSDDEDEDDDDDDEG